MQTHPTDVAQYFPVVQQENIILREGVRLSQLIKIQLLKYSLTKKVLE